MAPKLPLPRGWKHRVRSSVLHILALSHYTFTAMVARASNDRDRRTRRRAEIDRLEHEIALLQEELRIKDARMARVTADPTGQLVGSHASLASCARRLVPIWCQRLIHVKVTKTKLVVPIPIAT